MRTRAQFGVASVGFHYLLLKGRIPVERLEYKGTLLSVLVYFSRGTLPKKGKRAPLGDLGGEEKGISHLVKCHYRHPPKYCWNSRALRQAQRHQLWFLSTQKYFAILVRPDSCATAPSCDESGSKHRTLRNVRDRYMLPPPNTPRTSQIEPGDFAPT